jgi:hypothetical protein
MGCVSPPMSFASFDFLSSSVALSVSSLASFSSCYVVSFVAIFVVASSFCFASRSIVALAYTSALSFSLSALIFFFLFSALLLFFKTFSLSLLILLTDTYYYSCTNPECFELKMGEDHSASSYSAFFLDSSLAFFSFEIFPFSWPLLLKITSSYV